MRIVQIFNRDLEGRVALVDGDRLRLLDQANSVYELALEAISKDRPLGAGIEQRVSSESLSYDDVYEGAGNWELRPAFHHPDPPRCLVSGTGLTHRKSAQNRNAMHEAAQATITDSMRMYQWGEEGGSPAPGQIGAPPEWFYKGSGTILRAHNEPLVAPNYADDGGEESEIAGLYVIDWQGAPRRVGMAVGNEFSDHQMERKNYLYLAPSKLRTCSIGPELVIDPDFSGSVEGLVRIERSGKTVWSQPLATGEANMCHSLENMEHHHFKYAAHREPGDVHVHFFGAGAFSFGAGISLEDGDIMHAEFKEFGRALRNPIRIDRTPQSLTKVRSL